MLYPKHVSQFQGLKNIPFFQNFAVFATLFNVRAYIDGRKNTTLFTCFLVRAASYQSVNTSAPPPPISYITFFWSHQLYYPLLAKSVILPCSGQISHITLFLPHQSYYLLLVTSVILPYSGHISYITLALPHQSYYPLLATSVILPSSCHICHITLFLPHQSYYLPLTTSIIFSLDLN